MNPTFLELDEVLEIHAGQIDLYGGSAGIRDLELLESALSMPRAGIGGVHFHPDVHAMAAAYLFHIVKDHPLVDGNKRVGAVVSAVFLKLNGYVLECSNEALVQQVLAVAEGRADKAEIAAFFQRRARHRG